MRFVREDKRRLIYEMTEEAEINSGHSKWLKKTGALNAMNSLLNFDKLHSDGKVTLAKRK